MKSGWLTLITVGCLYGTYRLYTAFVSPLMQPVLLQNEQVRTVAATEIKPLSIVGRIARTHLPGQGWAESAKYSLQRGEETFLFFNTQKQLDTDKQNRLRVSPFAIVWIDSRSDEEAAYTLVCGSAVIEFESALEFGQSNPGRIVWGQLQGNVRITGPDNLQITGQNFYLDEAAQRLHSDHPVQFAYGPRPGEWEQVRGHAERVDITLKESANSVLGNDMPRIGGIKEIALGKNVRLDLVMDDHGKPAPVTITCQQGFEYDVGSLLATFNDHVEVWRQTELVGTRTLYDWLKCDRLQLHFEEKADAAKPDLAGSPPPSGTILQTSARSTSRSHDNDLGISLDLDFRSLWAIGRRVILGSDENDLTARMQGLRYDAVTRTVEMRSDDGPVEAHFRDDELTCPFIRLRHDEDDKIEMAECLESGSVIRRNPETQQVEVESRWTERLVLSPDKETSLDVLEITGDAQVLQPLQKTGIVADSLKVWLDGDALQSADGDYRSAMSRAGEGSELPLRKVVASSHVALVSPTLHLETSRLVAEFVAGHVAETSLERPGAKGDEPASADKDEAAEQPVVVVADSVVALLVFDPVTEKTDVLQLRATDRVAISRASSQGDSDAERSEDPFSIEANEVELRNQNGSHVLRLLGTPARIRHPEAEIEGNELYFDRRGNLARVEGVGALSILVESDLEGHPLDVPQPLTVRWEEQMTFDGLEAKFFGRVRTTLADSNLLCGRMAVSLDRKLSFAADRPQAEGLEIERIACHDGVDAEYIEWDGTTLIGIRKVQAAELVVNLASGDIRAQGPGRIDDWRKGGRRRHIRIDPTADSKEEEGEESASNRRLPWEYTRVKFAGEMTGNQTDRFLTLHDRVRVMHGPVENPLDTIDRDEFSQETERAKNAIWIGSDTLQVRLVPGDTDEAADTVSVLAKGNAELEGKVFRARADSISYDESKEMFTLKGRGTEASLWHQEQPGRPYREASAKTIQFVPSKRELMLDGVRGIRGTR